MQALCESPGVLCGWIVSMQFTAVETTGSKVTNGM